MNMRRDRQGLEGHGGGRGVGRVGESGGGNQGERALQVGINDDNHMLSTCTKNCKKRKLPSAGIEPPTHGFRVHRSTNYTMQDNRYRRTPSARSIGR